MCVLLDVTPDEALESVRANLFFVGVAHLARRTAVPNAFRAGRRRRQGRDQVGSLYHESLNNLAAERKSRRMNPADF